MAWNGVGRSLNSGRSGTRRMTARRPRSRRRTMPARGGVGMMVKCATGFRSHDPRNAPPVSVEWVVYAKKPFGGPQAVLRVSVALHSPRRDLQSLADLSRRGQRHLRVEGLP